MKNAICISAILAILIPTAAIPAHADRTLRGKLKAKKEITAGTNDDANKMVFDTVFSPSDSLIRIAGYDKPLNSRVESFFITNLLDRELTGIDVRLTYSDTSGRMLHEMTRHINVIVPPGATRRVQFPSWDRQQTFYYRRGRRPRTANVTPYDVRCTVISIIIPPATDD